MKTTTVLTTITLAGSFAATQSHAETPSLSIEAGKPVAKVSPMHDGLMTEEINYCYDGGLYAELVRNRAFLDHPTEPRQWSAVSGATIALDPKQPLNEAIPNSLRVQSASPGGGVANSGYWGIPVKPATSYRARFFAKAAPGFEGPLTVAIQSDDGATVYAQAEVPALTADWKSYSVTLTTGADAKPTTKARLALTMAKPGTVWLSVVSLFPPTWKDRPNGLRPDLMKMLVDLKPAFLRFPGGNYLEGDTIDNYDRKGPEIFVGEWAAHETPHPPWNPAAKKDPPTPNMKAAIGDAAFMTNMERNSDIVTMQAYAPLLVNVNERQWRPNLIGYDAINSYGSPVYYALRMFNRNVGDEILKTTLSQGSDLHYSVTKDRKSGTIFIKLVNPRPEAQRVEIKLGGLSSIAPHAKAEVLAAAPDVTNSITEPTNVVPVEARIDGIKPTFTHTLPATSIAVIKVETRPKP